MVHKKAVWSFVAAFLLICVPGFAQVADTSISGRVVDATGLPLPGTVVTVQGVDITQTFTTDGEGRYRFLDLAPRTYKVTSALQGFTTNVREHVVVNVGQTVVLPVTLAIGPIEATVTVTAPSPIVDAAQTGTATNVTADELARIPTSRDPFSLMRTVPGVLV